LETNISITRELGVSPMTASLFVRHNVNDYGAWRKFYDDADTIRQAHGCTAESVFRLPSDTNDVLVIHEFATVQQAEAFASDPGLKSAMQQGGVTSPPRIEIFESA